MNSLVRVSEYVCANGNSLVICDFWNFARILDDCNRIVSHLGDSIE